MVQVKVHGIRAFAASKAFYGGVSVYQIMQACHWKAHNTFTNFYLKDLTWSDDNNMYRFRPYPLVQVKVHDIRAFAASKAFYGGVSVYQIMQACHWKAHNTFTNFYLKDLTWSDDNNMYRFRPYPSDQVSSERKEEGGTSATTKSSGV